MTKVLRAPSHMQRSQGAIFMSITTTMLVEQRTQNVMNDKWNAFLKVLVISTYQGTPLPQLIMLCTDESSSSESL
uniref:Transposase n=1 Tax=Steinernema glaseri TaxID=37863 RepID=A0A1I7ZUC0_9BILA